jgi:hypothetical protein
VSTPISTPSRLKTTLRTATLSLAAARSWRLPLAVISVLLADSDTWGATGSHRVPLIEIT